MTGPVTGPFGHDFTRLAERLTQRKTRYVYVANPGNAGDALIAANTYAFFADHGIAYDVGASDGTYPGRDLIYAGGGNLIEAYDNASGFFRRNLAGARSVVVLPHTIRAHGDVLSAYGDRATCFAREAESLRYLRANVAGARIELGHDMAFYRDPRSLVGAFLPSVLRDVRRDLRHPGIARHHLRTHRVWRARVAGLPDMEPLDPTILHAYRTDVERTDIEIPADNVDLSEVLAHPGSLYPPMTTAIVSEMIRRIEPFGTVRTNRLHVAILATLLGKDVRASDNSYGKLAAIRERSMRQFGNLALES